MDDATNLDLAELLASVELFAGLDRVALAQLTAYVEHVTLEGGAMLFTQGDPADALYVVVRGTLGVFTSAGDGTDEARLSTLAPGDCIGEMALVTSEPRSATVRAEGRAEVLRLDRDNFLGLVRAQPAVASAVTTIVSGRLRAADRARLQGELTIARAVQDLLGRLGVDQRRRVLQASVLPEVSTEALWALFGEHAEEVDRELERLGLRNGRLSAVAARVLRQRFEQTVGPEAAVGFAAEAGLRLAEAACWEEALAVLARQPERGPFVSVLGRAVRGVPPLEGKRAGRWIERITEEEAAEDAELALAAAALQEERGNPQGGAQVLERALGTALVSGDAGAGERLTEAIARLSSEDGAAPVPRFRFGLRMAELAERRPRIRAVLAVAAATALALAAAAAGTANSQWVFVLLLGSALALWTSRLFPDFAVTLLLLGAWTLWGIADPAEALAGFATMDWVFVLAVLGIAVAVARSGLLFRVGLLMVRRMPSGLVWQAAALLLTGLLLSPLLPDPRGRAALTGPLALAVAQASRLRDREPAAAVLGLAAWIGSGPLMFLFLNASPVCLLAWGLLPAERRAQFDWLSWLAAALPLGVLTGFGALAALFILLRPSVQSAPSRERLSLQLAVLGPLSPRELAVLAVLVLTVAGWFIAPAIHVHVAVVAVFGLFAAVASGSFDQRSFREMDWGFLIYYGGALSIVHLAETLGIGHIVSGGAAGQIHLLEGTLVASAGPLAFILVVAVAGLLVRFVLEPNQAVLLLGLALVPAGSSIGVNPWVVIVALLATSSPWFTDKQTPAYEVAYSATDGRLYSHGQARKIAFGYAAATLAALALSVPYWRLIGLL